MKRFVAALTLLALSLSSAPAQQPPERGPFISVRGDGRAEANPDIARLTAEVVTRGRTLEAASSAHKERASRAAAALRALAGDGVAIEQSGFRLDQVRQPMPAPLPGQPAPRQDPEYQAVTSFEVKAAKLDRIDAVITAIASSGLLEIRNLRFGLDDKSTTLDAARRDAVMDAQRRARIYAEAAGVALGEVIEISDHEPRILREMAAPMAAAQRSMQVSPPENIAVTASVTMTWRIRPR